MKPEWGEPTEIIENLVRLDLNSDERASQSTRYGALLRKLNKVQQSTRAKSGNASTHSMDADEVRDLRKLRKETEGAFVFVTERGGPLSVEALQRIVKEAGLIAKIEVPVHPHMLRHAADAMINEGHDVRIV